MSWLSTYVMQCVDLLSAFYLNCSLVYWQHKITVGLTSIPAVIYSTLSDDWRRVSRLRLGSVAARVLVSDYWLCQSYFVTLITSAASVQPGPHWELSLWCSKASQSQTTERYLIGHILHIPIPLTHPSHSTSCSRHVASQPIPLNKPRSPLHLGL